MYTSEFDLGFHGGAAGDGEVPGKNRKCLGGKISAFPTGARVWRNVAVPPGGVVRAKSGEEVRPVAYL